MAKLKAIRTALEVDLAAISGAVVRDVTEPDTQTGDKYIVFAPADGSETATEEISFKGTGGMIAAAQLYTVKTNRVGTRDDADDWIDEIKDAVESGTALGISYVDSIRVAEWESTAGDNHWTIEASIIAKYKYARGSA